MPEELQARRRKRVLPSRHQPLHLLPYRLWRCLDRLRPPLDRLCRSRLQQLLQLHRRWLHLRPHRVRLVRYPSPLGLFRKPVLPQ